MKLTFPNEQWRVYTQPSADVPWSGPTRDDPSYHVLIALIPDIALVLQVLVQPMLDQEISLDDYLAVTRGGMEMGFGGDFVWLSSEVVQRGGRTIGVAVYRLRSMKFLWVVFPEEDRFTALAFNCFEGLFESRRDEFWSIADSYQYVLRPDEAAAVTRRAAEQGDANAQFKLGVAYQYGRGVPRDDAKAAEWYRQAAEQGVAEAQFNLGVAYQYGRGVPQDDAEAANWYRQAAEQGNPEAQANLGFMYDRGTGVPQDDAEAANWYRQAAEQGYAPAQFSLGVMYDEGTDVPENDAEAANWYRQAAEQGYAPAQFNLGVMYEEGTGVPQDDAEAADWYRQAAEQGEAWAQRKLGAM
jgi:TPR repeat protein